LPGKSAAAKKEGNSVVATVADENGRKEFACP
jgi:hypothetical protein